MTNPLISLVLPIYKVEEFLHKCVASILNQTYQNIEVLLVNDGSPDGCGDICDEFALKDHRVKVFHLANGGVAKARQFGVENSHGEFIMLVDPDDWMPNNAVEILYLNMSNDVDLVTGASTFHTKERVKYRGFNSTTTRKLSNAGLNKSRILESKEYLELLIAREAEVAPWAKLYRRTLFTQDSFLNVKHTQDLLMNIDVATRIRKVRYINEIVYCYLYRKTSNSKTFLSTFEYEKMFCNMVRKILENNVCINDYSTAYAKCLLYSIGRVIYAGNKVDIHDPMVQLVVDNLKGVKLSITQRCIILSLKSQFLRKCIFWGRNIILLLC